MTYKELHPSVSAACVEQSMIHVVIPMVAAAASALSVALVAAPKALAARKTRKKSLVLANMIV